MSTRPGGISTLNTPQGREALRILENSYRLPPANPPPPIMPPISPPPGGGLGGLLRRLAPTLLRQLIRRRILGDPPTPPDLTNDPIRQVRLPPNNRRGIRDYPPGFFVSMVVRYKNEYDPDWSFKELTWGPNGERILTPVVDYSVTLFNRWDGGWTHVLRSGSYNGFFTNFSMTLSGGDPVQSINFRSGMTWGLNLMQIVGFNIESIGNVPEVGGTPISLVPPRPTPPRRNLPRIPITPDRPSILPPNPEPEPEPTPENPTPPNDVPVRPPLPGIPRRDNPNDPTTPDRIGRPIRIDNPSRLDPEVITVQPPQFEVVPPPVVILPPRPPIVFPPLIIVRPPRVRPPVVVNPPEEENPPTPTPPVITPPPPGPITPFIPGTLRPVRPGDNLMRNPSPVPPCESDACLSGIANLISGIGSNVTNIARTTIQVAALNEFLESNDVGFIRQKLGQDYPQTIEQQIDNSVKQQSKALDANLYGVAAALYNSIQLSKNAKNDLGDIYARLNSTLGTTFQNPLGQDYPRESVSPATASGKVRESLGLDIEGNIPDEMAKANRLAILGSNLHHASILNSTASIKGIEKVLEYLGNINNALARTGKLSTKFAGIKPIALSLKTQEIDALDGVQPDEGTNPNDGDFYQYLIDDLKLKANTIESIEQFVEQLIEQSDTQIPEIENQIEEDRDLTDVPSIPEIAHYPE